jgi:CBS domain-containing protein
MAKITKPTNWLALFLIAGLIATGALLLQRSTAPTPRIELPYSEFSGLLANEVIAKNHSLDRTNVYEIMSNPTLTLNAGMDIKYAIRLLGRFGLERALVIDHNELVGLVTLRNMVFCYVDIDRTAEAYDDEG